MMYNVMVEFWRGLSFAFVNANQTSWKTNIMYLPHIGPYIRNRTLDVKPHLDMERVVHLNNG